jgi:hypothetical protein
MSNFDEAGTKGGETPADAQASARPKPVPVRYLYGRPVYTKEQLAEMDPFLPPEPEWAAEWERFEAAELAKKS